jgi:hypothetical protein
MKDEVKITVIATGFERRPEAVKPVAAAAAAGARTSIPLSVETELDIPAFIRRK